MSDELPTSSVFKLKQLQGLALEVRTRVPKGFSRCWLVSVKKDCLEIRQLEAEQLKIFFRNT